ncbi:helix-turn-helix domain-containing protein [Lapidilactobacillus wuchangensis]|uniref:helix-turn-helix domain-containing protein n=1 Tax=Lapidilactobacillus wuchangensis TaxID=2486001 RepID=UPI000F787264|nr:AraC family transcriptional regulator [Lapidilactobacillus wuchangensis]
MKIMISEQFQQFMAKIGIDLNNTLAAANVNKVIWQEQLELTDKEYWQLMNELDNELSDEVVVQFGDINNINTFMPSFFAALAAKNGRQAIERLATYKALIGPVKLIITADAELVSIRAEGTSLGIELPRFTVLTEQLLLISLLRVGTGRVINPSFVGSKYHYGPKISNVMGIQPQRQNENLIQFRTADLEQTFISTNNSMWTFLQPELDRQKLANERDKSLVANVQAILLKKIPSGQFSLDDVAASLNLSRRTLQRNLSALGTTFNDEVQIARQTLVLPLMKDRTLSLIEIGYLLGYADPETFSRAFKKWFQESPSVYRVNKFAELK